MNIPFLNKNQDQYYYPEDGSDKKKMILVFAGILVVVLLGALLLFSGGGGDNAGQLSMQQSVKSTNEVLSIITTYELNLSNSGTVNDVALIEIILDGNFQKLNDLYVASYKGKPISPQQKPDDESAEILDRAVRNNTIDTEIIDVLKTKITQGQESLSQASADFTKQSSIDQVKLSLEDFNSIQGILDKPR